MNDPSRDKPFIFAPDESPPADTGTEVWKILIVDDDHDVHLVTQLVLGGRHIFDRSLALYSAYSAEECRTQMFQHPDIAVVLMDVVMDEDDTGLQLCRWIRQDLGNASVRIILRTGQPGRAPESRVIEDYEINDYKEKTELTNDRLWTSLVTALRGYRDIRTIEMSRFGMESIVRYSPDLFIPQTPALLASTVLAQCTGMLSLSRSPQPENGQGARLPGISGIAILYSGEREEIAAGTGRFAGQTSFPVSDVLGIEACAFLAGSAGQPGIYIQGNFLLLNVEEQNGRRWVFFFENTPSLNETVHKILQLFYVNVRAACSDTSLYGELDKQLKEKTLLLREVHHRVKNNMQIIMSLINLSQEQGETYSPRNWIHFRERIAVMTQIHERSYSSGDTEYVDFAEISWDISHDLSLMNNGSLSGNVITARVRNFVLPLGLAVPCSLLIEEILLHLFSHPGMQTMAVELLLEGSDDSFEVSLSTDVPFDSAHASTDSLSLQLIDVLTVQLRASLKTDVMDGKLVYRVNFSV